MKKICRCWFVISLILSCCLPQFADAEAMENVTVYHAGTAVVDGQLVTNGGRVLAVTALGDTFENARNLAYEACEKIDFEGKTLRHDIGLRALRGRDAWDA